MTESEISNFVSQFCAAWAARDGDAFLALWHADGLLHYPFTDRPLRGSEIGKLNELQNANAPKLAWQLIHWTWRGNVVVIEWQSANVYGERKITWRGVDKITLRDGKIIEEVVYSDTAPLRELREGRKFAPLLQIPE
jgi:ketosteroid isomerase-like protein